MISANNEYDGLWGNLFQKIQERNQNLRDRVQEAADSFSGSSANSHAIEKLRAALYSTTEQQPLSDANIVPDDLESVEPLKKALTFLSSLNNSSNGVLSQSNIMSVAVLQGWLLSHLLQKDSQLTGQEKGAGSMLPSFVVEDQKPKWSSFTSLLTARLQNFGSAEGFRGAYLLTPEQPNVSVESIQWGTSFAFTLDCQRESGTFYSLTRMYSCAMAVAGENGGGALIRQQMTASSQLNSISLTTCNVLDLEGREGEETQRWTLESLKLNGRAVLTQPMNVEQVRGIGYTQCQKHLFQVLPQALNRGFVLNGLVRLNRQQEYGAGSLSSMSFEVGEYNKMVFADIMKQTSPPL